jgi:hypothetical protein
MLACIDDAGSLNASAWGSEMIESGHHRRSRFEIRGGSAMASEIVGDTRRGEFSLLNAKVAIRAASHDVELALQTIARVKRSHIRGAWSCVPIYWDEAPGMMGSA